MFLIYIKHWPFTWYLLLNSENVNINFDTPYFLIAEDYMNRRGDITCEQFSCICAIVKCFKNRKYSKKTAIGTFLTKLRTGLFACLFVCGFSSHYRIFHSNGEVSVTGKRLQILTLARHLWGFFSVPRLLWHVSFDNSGPC